MAHEKTLIIIPTYNEAENIEELYVQIKRCAADKDLLFVDDNSKDATRRIIEKIMTFNKSVHILKRENRQGIARAYIAGFSWGMEKDYAWFQEMDADLSHPPEYLPVIDGFKTDYDVIIGSRYIKNGKVEKWNPVRRFFSFFGCQYLKLILGSHINDLTGGFNCWRRQVLENIDFSEIISSGFNFQAEMKFLAMQKGFKLVEFPFVFRERKKGKSKLTALIIIEGLLKPFFIRIKYLKQYKI